MLSLSTGQSTCQHQPPLHITISKTGTRVLRDLLTNSKSTMCIPRECHILPFSSTSYINCSSTSSVSLGHTNGEDSRFRRGRIISKCSGCLMIPCRTKNCEQCVYRHRPRIFECIPRGIRIISMIRDPIKRLISEHSYLYSNISGLRRRGIRTESYEKLYPFMTSHSKRNWQLSMLSGAAFINETVTDTHLRHVMEHVTSGRYVVGIFEDYSQSVSLILNSIGIPKYTARTIIQTQLPNTYRHNRKFHNAPMEQLSSSQHTELVTLHRLDYTLYRFVRKQLRDNSSYTQ